MVKAIGGQETSEHFVVYARGAAIFSSGEMGDDLFIVREGQVELFVRVGERESRIAVLGAGDFFGERAMLDIAPRHYSARALTECSVLPIPGASLDAMVEQNPEIAQRMMRKLVARLLDTEVALQETLRKQDGRVETSATPAPASGAPSAKDAAERSARDAGERSARDAGERSARDAGERSAKDAAGAAAGRPTEDAAPSAAAGSPAKGAPRLIHESGAEFSLASPGEILVGRPDTTTGATPDVDLSTLDGERTISRRHAKLFWRGDQLYLCEPTATANGTFVNGKRLEPGVPVELRDGDRIAFGMVLTVYHAG
jgi:CRP-like cAMP-binding protein